MNLLLLIFLLLLYFDGLITKDCIVDENGSVEYVDEVSKWSCDRFSVGGILEKDITPI